ncbi:DUF882 domain-containing protein [Phreatobacter sp.]|uniref:DUF882 domain-containing protein n=1 Tax=Phreatobacter sp. TaxID=1966341 RepID=UPI0022C428EB|nr:DUF882 domain-containing protein [Phreatobacter sp.]MCZ8315317.1 DUF882 domain-containing protein [Phreatobacter sp.]
MPGLVSRKALRACATVTLGVGFLIAISNSTQTVVANGDTRTLSMLHKHTGEQILITFKRNGRYDQEALNKLNWFLRDWRRDEPTRMDPHLFDIVWEVYRSVGAQSQIHVVSAYRSAGTNAMLRRRSRGVAQQSRHITGQAMDFYIPGASMTRVREAGLLLQRGGVGFYPGSANQFVHMDTGSVRHWPKVSRDYLARLFPDGRTVHIPSDGRPLAGFETALAMVRARGGTASRFYDSRADEAVTYEDDDDSARGGVIRQRSSSMGLFAGLFGNRQQQAAPAPQPAAPAPAPAPAAEAAPAPAAAAPAQPVPTAINQPAPGRPVQIVTNAPPRMQIAAAPLPLRAPPAAERLRGNAEEEAEPRLVAAPLPAARPAMPGTAVALAPEPSTRPTVLSEPAAVAQAPLPPARPQVLAAASSQPTLPPLITTGEQRGRQAEGEPAMALAFASPSQPVTLPGQTSLQGPQPRPAQAVRAAPQAPVQAAMAPATAPRPAARPTRVAAPAMVPPNINGSRGTVVFARQTTDRAVPAATLQAPDPRERQLLQQPAQVVAMTFSASAPATVPTQRFSGEAVASLRTLEFAEPAAPARQRGAWLSR